MGIRDMLKKKEKGDANADTDDYDSRPSASSGHLAAPEFTFIRSDTTSQNIIHPPDGPKLEPFPGVDDSYLSADNSGNGSRKSRLSLDVFHRGRRASAASLQSSTPERTSTDGPADSRPRRLSQRLHLGRSPSSSDLVPQNLPEIVVPVDGNKDAVEAQWEERATLLAQKNEQVMLRNSRPGTPERSRSSDYGAKGLVSSKEIDDSIQTAIVWHEENRLAESTAMFGRLADQGIPLAQVLFGLALRNGWGCAPDPKRALEYLRRAASVAADIETSALHSGLKKGGAAKGELSLAIFELAETFRSGKGLPGEKPDLQAAKEYYETVANLGDTDAQWETGRCYEHGIGTKKDKYTAARYYRMAEDGGRTEVGMSWIRKDKYMKPRK